MKTMFIVAVVLLAACAPEMPVQQEEPMPKTNETTEALATFAGGCFWCMEPPFEKLDGVSAVISGYAGGDVENPTYKQVGRGDTGHREAVQIHYNPDVISYEDLLEVFWQQIDPTDPNGQFVDRGFQYTTAIWYHDEAQKEAAEKSLKIVNESGRFSEPVVTPILPYKNFYPAEEYHQDYYKKNKIRYKLYRSGSGRDVFLDKTWPEEGTVDILPDTQEETVTEDTFTKPSDEELQEMLSPIQYHVTQEDGTEKPFENEYWNNTEPGIYVDILSGEPLFSSTDKYKSGTGWPSFTKPLEEDNIVLKKDFKLILPRTEVRSKTGDNHIGHVFNDGPEPTGKRYCMNSAALKFIPADELEEEGYGQYSSLFE